MSYANDVKKRIDRYSPVKCKDCMYNKGEVNKKGFRICSANGMDITDDDYCSWGERMKTIRTNQHLTGVTTITDNNDEITSIIVGGEGYSKARYGIWIWRAEAMFGNPYGRYECSICGNGMPQKTQYCCYCGAKMDIGEEG